MTYNRYVAQQIVHGEPSLSIEYVAVDIGTHQLAAVKVKATGGTLVRACGCGYRHTPELQ